MSSGLCFLVALLLCSLPVHAAPEIDQVCLPQIWRGYSIAVGGPIGQEFVPTVSSLTFVDLWIQNGTSSADDSARVFVVIRADSIGGAELGSSDDDFIPKPFYDEIRLSFPMSVGLEPGRTYVIEARVQGPGNPLLAAGDLPASCPGISGIFLGKAFANGEDFWFRTGQDLTPVTPIPWSRWKILFR